jgi:hypothetical protein
VIPTGLAWSGWTVRDPPSSVAVLYRPIGSS